MFHAPHRAAALACALLASTALAAPALAQSSGAPSYRNLDANGVDLTHGGFYLDFLEGSIGSGEAELQLRRRNAGRNQWDAIELERSTSGSAVTVWVTLGFETEKFTGTASSLTSTKANGGTLTGGGGGYVYQGRDGTTISFVDPTNHQWGGESNLCNGGAQANCRLIPDSITSPDGRSVSFEWNLANYCSNEWNFGTLDCQFFWRVAKVTNSYGQQINFSYATDTAGGALGYSPPADWSKRTRSDFVNTLVSTSPQAAVTYAYPATGVTDVTDMAGRTWRFSSISGGATTGIRRPGAATDTTTISYGPGTINLTRDGVATSYARTVSGSTATTTVTNALNQVTTIVSDLTIGRSTSVTNNALSRTISYQYDSFGRRTRVTQPEGNYVQLTLDARGNVTQQQAVAKGGAATITTSATYAADCQSNPSCNQPLTTTDPLGNVTNYAYDSTHGGLLSVTAPAPVAGAVRPETRYSYTDGLLTGVSACQTGSSCAGTSAEVKATIAYNLDGTVATVSQGDGSGALSATRAMTYDAMGNLLTIDGPLAGASDTTRFRYNAARELIGTISPDPDGGGALRHRAVRRTIGSNALLTKVERGSVNSQSDADWGLFASLEAVEIGYDGNARPVTQKLVSGGTVHSLTQASYDALGRPECSAVRMNPAAFGAAVSACAPGAEGSFGPDRIGKTIYNAAGEVTEVRSAVGTALEAAEVTTTYTANGRVQSVTDAEANKTSYEYDGFDRLTRTVYPSAAAHANASNPSDYEQLTYDAGGNVVSRRLRDSASISYSHDALGRLIGKNLPNAAVWEFDNSYAYDNLGRLVSAVNTNTHAVRFTYDALGRTLSEGSDHYGGKTFQYDIAGRRTRMTWRDGFFVTYDYLATGEVAAIRENGASSGAGVLASFAYDDLGRRTQLSRGNGTVTNYSYDAASRLGSLVHDLGGADYDSTTSFAYNPASQIASNTRSNDAYAWNAHFNVNRGYAANGLNQYTQSGPIVPTYDAKGNLTSAGATSYTYTAENQLAVYSGATVGGLAYDPLGRLYYIGAPDSWLDYAGSELATEIKAGGNSILRRYVHGPGTDEPLVWYEGAGTSDRRFLHADERGSIVAVSDSAGGVIGANRYDEYGIPAATNIGRFQYTGQTWLAELGMYYYKARIYSPTLGRFLQTDPVGYGDGMNMYAYVGGDPVNFRDPLGLSGQCVGTSPASGCRPDEGRDREEHRRRTAEECAARPDYCATGRRPSPPPAPLPPPPLPVARGGADPRQGDGGGGGGGGGGDGTPGYQPPGSHGVSRPRKPDWCGSQGFNVPDGSWREACKAHDRCYATRGASKESCDLALIASITWHCGKVSLTATNVIGCAGIGIMYGGGLIFFGIPNPLFQPSRDAYNDAQGANR